MEEVVLGWPKPDRTEAKKIIDVVDEFRIHGWGEFGMTKLRLELG